MEKVFFIDRKRPTDTLPYAVKIIRQGGIVLSSTDTVYGLACDPHQPDGVKKIQELKKRPAEKGFLLLIPTPDWVDKLASRIPKYYLNLKQFWPGPLTLLLPAGPNVPKSIVSSDEKVGIRCPDHFFLKSWLEHLGHPLLSTSANLSGEKLLTTITDLRETFEHSVDLLIFDKEEDQTEASTVVDLTVDRPQIIRPGKLANRVQKVLKKIIQENIR